MNESALFGITLLVAGLGGTLLVLSLMAVVIHLLTIIFPAKKPHDRETTL